MRDNYARSLKKQDECNKSGSERKKIQRYIFEEQLSFLKKSRELRPTISSMQPNLNEEVETTNSSDNMAIGDESVVENDSIKTIENTNNTEKTTFKPPPSKIKKKINLEEKLALFLDLRQQIYKEPAVILMMRI